MVRVQFTDTVIDSPLFPQAKCVEIEDKDFFFPDTVRIERKRLTQLRQICGGCIHRKECLDFALKNGVEHGFWGGKTPKERRVPDRKVSRVVRSVKAQKIRLMLEQEKSANEISKTLDCSQQYVYKIVAQLKEENREEESQSNQIQNQSLKESSLLRWLSQ
jgi:WhiB family redox-sensing transcriptional regulator